MSKKLHLDWVIDIKKGELQRERTKWDVRDGKVKEVTLTEIHIQDL